MFIPFPNGPDLSPYVGVVMAACVIVAAAALALVTLIVVTGGFRDKNRGNR